MSSSLSVLLPSGSIESYVSSIYNIPLLSPEEEYSLALAVRDENNLLAAQKLIVSHLRFVVKLARGYMGYNLPLSDLLQEGTIGLMKAVRKFDPTVGVRLAVYAVHWIKSSIREYVIRNWRLVKVATTKAQRKLFFRLRSFKNDTKSLTSEEVSLISRELSVSESDVYQMEQRLYSTDISFDPLEDDPEDTLTPSGYLSDSSFEPSNILSSSDPHLASLVSEAISSLSPRSKEIFISRMVKEPKETLSSLSLRFSISIERVRQIESKALSTVKSYLRGKECLGA